MAAHKLLDTDFIWFLRYKKHKPIKDIAAKFKVNTQAIYYHLYKYLREHDLGKSLSDINT